MPAPVTIAKLTILEASRRRLLLAVVVLTLVIVLASAWGFHKLWDIRNGGQPITESQVRLISSQLLILITFMFSFVLALVAVLLASFSLPSEIETGVVLAMLARPLRRSELILGKWLGLALLTIAYALLAGAAEMAVVNLNNGYTPPHPVGLLAYVSAEGLALLSFALLLSTRLPGIAGGAITAIAFFMAWIGGIVGGIGAAFQNQAIEDVGIFSRLVLPTDALWRGAVYSMEPSSVLAAARAAGPAASANPFYARDGQPVSMLLWVAFWFIAVVGLTLWSFRTREV
jgi:ABC-type transport system involved in multi-copper enzyme maturation permease subunit